MNKMRVKIRLGAVGEDGFSLVESVVAIFLLTVGLLSAASVLGAVAGHQKVSYVLITAASLAEEEIETLRHDTYLGIQSEVEDFGEIDDHIAFKREVIVTPNAMDTMRTIEVKVSHLGGQHVNFHTLIAR